MLSSIFCCFTSEKKLHRKSSIQKSQAQILREQEYEKIKHRMKAGKPKSFSEFDISVQYITLKQKGRRQSAGDIFGGLHTITEVDSKSNSRLDLRPQTEKIDRKRLKSFRSFSLKSGILLNKN